MSCKSDTQQNTRQPKQIRRQTIFCLPNTTANSYTTASVIQLGVTHFKSFLSRWKISCRIQERNGSNIKRVQPYFKFRGNVDISSSLTLPNTVISLIKVVYESERTLCYQYMCMSSFVSYCLLKSYSMHSILGYVRSASTHHHRLSSYRCPPT
jgi:hypothetical protein